MFLRLLLRLVRPANELLKSGARAGGVSRCRLVLYRWLLGWLRRVYLRCAVSDTVLLEGGRIRIVHEVRDLEFENELKRNGVDIEPHLRTTDMPLRVSGSGRGAGRGYFKWRDVLCVYIDERELLLKHDAAFTVDGTLPARVKRSSAEDIIGRCVVEQRAGRRARPEVSAAAGPPTEKRAAAPPATVPPSPEPGRAGRQLKRGSLFGRDTIPAGIVTTDVPEGSVREPASVRVIEKRGFEIDTSF